MTEKASAERETIPFEYWSDPLCIWAFVSQPKLDRLLGEKRAALEVHYRVVVVFASVPWRFRDGPWKDVGPEGRATATREIAARFGHDDVDGNVWLEDPPASSWSAGAAVEAVRLAERVGEAPPESCAAYQVALRRALFVDNRNVARREVQLEAAESLDLDRAVIEARLDDGTALAQLAEDQRRKETQGIHGSPTYVFDDGRALLYGNFAEGILRATVDELLAGLHGSSRY